MTVISEPAHAKLNLFLRVLGRRDDGYHDIETLVQPVTIADGVQATPGDSPSLTVVGPLAGRVPSGEGNLMLRATRALAEAAGVAPEARLLLVKKIPVSAGLGGGSADAAATLRALNDLWSLGLPRERLIEVAAEVGSDVPALVPTGPVLARGRGDRVEVAEAARTWWVLLPQDLPIAAGDAYAWWDEDGQTGPDPGGLVAAARAGDLEALARGLSNDLQAPIERRHREVGEGRRRLLEAGALAAIVSGSGPTVVGLCRDGRHAAEVAAAVEGTAAASIHPF